MRVLRTLLHPNLRIVALALCAMGILHVCVTLAAPRLAPSPAYKRLAANLALHSMQILPPVAPASQPLPFMSSDARYAVCRFDTTKGPVGVRATLPGPGWVLALYSPAGDNFYVAVAQPGRRTDVSLTLVPSDERFTGLTPQAQGKPAVENSTLTVGAEQGIVLVRAPDQGAAYQARNLAELKRAVCVQSSK